MFLILVLCINKDNPALVSLAVGDSSGIDERKAGDDCDEDDKRLYAYSFYKKKLDTLSKTELAEEIKLSNRRNSGSSFKKLGTYVHTLLIFSYVEVLVVLTSVHISLSI